MPKRLKITLTCLLLIISTLSGCIQGPTQGRPGGDAPAFISIWYSLEGQEEQELLKQLERISIENNEVVVRGERIPEANFGDYVWKMQAGGQGPDILIASRSHIFALYEKGAISPVLTEKKKAFSLTEALFTFSNELYAAPWLTDVPLLYYRKDKVNELPKDLNEIWTKKATMAITSLDTALLSPWWKAEGGNLSLAGIPQLDSPANLAFMKKILYLKSEGLLIFDNQALEKLASGEVSYAIAWASQRDVLERFLVEWDILSFEMMLGKSGKPLLDKTIGIANSSIKTNSARQGAILMVEEELLKTETVAAMIQAGNRISVSQAYYETSQPFNNAIAKILNTAWMIAPDHTDWYYIGIQDSSWSNILAGSSVESELEKAQQSALNLLK